MGLPVSWGTCRTKSSCGQGAQGTVLEKTHRCGSKPKVPALGRLKQDNGYTFEASLDVMANPKQINKSCLQPFLSREETNGVIGRHPKKDRNSQGLGAGEDTVDILVGRMWNPF
ncbi:uncharacterized protein LOC143440761 [Arvicanthis niloticus]|uniref:uncharacterized protein LOC143311025 n=1 Tax=Arvicanthis niloticus TaxID=61156 RepID=UPI00402B6F0B